MIFKEIEFKDEAAQKIYSKYIEEVQKQTTSLSKESQLETLLEINSHIYEALSISPNQEKENLVEILNKLGKPEMYLKELVAEKKLEEAAKSFNPFKIIKALILNITNGIAYVIYLLLYLSLFTFIFLIIAKLIDPDGVGLFYKKGEFALLGKMSQVNVNAQQFEQLGNWFIPIMILSTLLFYFIITLFLKFRKTLKKKRHASLFFSK